MSSIFGGPSLSELAELWKAQNSTYESHKEPASVRSCCCVGYLTNPDGRCCMDLPQGNVVTSDKIVIGRVEPEVIAQGWQCPLCKKVNAPHVDSCDCQTNWQATTSGSTTGGK